MNPKVRARLTSRKNEPDLGTENLLCDVHAVRRGGEARLLGDRDEVPEMAQLNVHRWLSLTARIQTVRKA